VLGHCGGSTSDIVDAIVWASGGQVAGVPENYLDIPAHVINMSLGGGGACTANSAMGAAIAEANSRGTVVVVAAGLVLVIPGKRFRDIFEGTMHFTAKTSVRAITRLSVRRQRRYS